MRKLSAEELKVIVEKHVAWADSLGGVLYTPPRESASYSRIVRSGDWWRYDEPGVEHISHPVVMSVHGDRFSVLKIQGATKWSGRGETSYYPTEYRLVEFDSGSNRVMTHAKFEPGKKWRKCLDGLNVLADAMAREHGSKSSDHADQSSCRLSDEHVDITTMDAWIVASLYPGGGFRGVEKCLHSTDGGLLVFESEDAATTSAAVANGNGIVAWRAIPCTLSVPAVGSRTSVPSL